MFWLELTDSNCHQCCKLRCVDLHGIQSLCARLHSLRLNNLRQTFVIQLVLGNSFIWRHQVSENKPSLIVGVRCLLFPLLFLRSEQPSSGISEQPLSFHRVTEASARRTRRINVARTSLFARGSTFAHASPFAFATHLSAYLKNAQKITPSTTVISKALLCTGF